MLLRAELRSVVRPHSFDLLPLIKRFSENGVFFMIALFVSSVVIVTVVVSGSYGSLFCRLKSLTSHMIGLEQVFVTGCHSSVFVHYDMS